MKERTGELGGSLVCMFECESVFKERKRDWDRRFSPVEQRGGKVDQ